MRSQVGTPWLQRRARTRPEPVYHFDDMHEVKTIPCGLCGRGFARDHLTQHHCKPKSRGGTIVHVALICSQCQGMVHATFTNRTLEALYPTIEQLRMAPELAAFIKWVRKQPITRKTRNAPRRRRIELSVVDPLR